MLEFFRLMGLGPEGWGKVLLIASGVTISVAVSGFLIGTVIGAALAHGRIAGNRTVRIAAEFYTTLMRSIPELLVIYLFYFGGSLLVTSISTAFGAHGYLGVSPFVTGALAIGFVSAAYQGEVFRGAFRSLPVGQIEAGQALGMGRAPLFLHVVGPQVLRHALPGLGNAWQSALKDSALVSVTGLVELLRQAQIAAGSTRRPFEFFLIAGAIYLLITWVSQVLFDRLEQRSWRGRDCADGM